MTDLLTTGNNGTNNPEQVADMPITNARQGFKAFFEGGISLPKLTDGVYEAILQAATFVDAKTDKDKPYVRLELKLADRIIIDNRFETGFGIFEQHVKEQLGISDQAIPMPDLIALLKTSPFKIWVTHALIEGRNFRNINYIPPIAKPTATDGATEGTEMGTGDF